MVNQLQNEYIDETSDDSLSKDWNKMQQDVRVLRHYNYRYTNTQHISS